jgi:hypothetical protein
LAVPAGPRRWHPLPENWVPKSVPTLRGSGNRRVSGRIAPMRVPVKLSVDARLVPVLTPQPLPMPLEKWIEEVEALCRVKEQLALLAEQHPLCESRGELVPNSEPPYVVQPDPCLDLIACASATQAPSHCWIERALDHGTPEQIEWSLGAILGEGDA